MRLIAGELRQLIREAFGDAYKILGVPQNASADEIKAAFRKLAIALHPDRNRDRDTTRDMVKVNAAYTLLSDPTKRMRYDMMGDKTVDTFDAPAPKPQPAPPPHRPYTPPQPPKPQPPPPRPQSSHTHSPPPRSSTGGPSAPSKRYFEYTDAHSRKYWWIMVIGDTVHVGYGRIFRPGQMRSKQYPSSYAARTAAARQIRSKLNKGYQEMEAHGPAKWQTPPKSTGAPPPSSTHGGPSRPQEPRSGEAKKTYKVYGKGPPGDRGGSPAHTGYKGKFYKAPGNTKFRANDRAEVELGPDGKLKVKNPSTGHTQSWTRESVAELLGELITEHLLAWSNG